MDERASELIAIAQELEARDVVVAEQLRALDDLADRTAALRARAREVGARLDALPAEQAAAVEARAVALADEQHARSELAACEARIASFGRRTSQDERDQAARELARAHEEVHDAGVRLERSAARIAELDDLAPALRAEADGLIVQARTVAAEIQRQPRVPDAGKGPLPAELALVEEWGARARAALFVARGPLARERQRIVDEANLLGSTVLGEPLGASSAALVRRRIGEALGGTSGETG